MKEECPKNEEFCCLLVSHKQEPGLRIRPRPPWELKQDCEGLPRAAKLTMAMMTDDAHVAAAHQRNRYHRLAGLQNKVQYFSVLISIILVFKACTSFTKAFDKDPTAVVVFCTPLSSSAGCSWGAQKRDSARGHGHARADGVSEEK